MELNEYQQKAMETCMQSSNNLSYALLGFLGKVGELLEKTDVFIPVKNESLIDTLFYAGSLAKQIRKQEQLPLDYTTIKGFDSELGDLEWFLSLLAKQINSTKEEICQMNLQKLASRKERNVISGDGDNR